jgi:glycosyltransferase involved in cell wall biosynthesis
MDHSKPSIISWINDLRAGGAETTLLLELEALRERGFDVAVGITGHDMALGPKFKAAGIRVFELGSGSIFRRAINLFKILRRERPDIVETILFWPNLFVRPLARILGIKVVTQLANEEYGHVQRSESRFGPLGVTLAQLSDLVTSRFSNEFRAVAEGVAVMMRKRLLIPERKMKVIHIARDLSLLGRNSVERRRETRERLQLADDLFVVLNTGRQDAQKNQTTAIRAVANLAKSGVVTVLLIAGRSGQSTPQVSELVMKLGDQVDVRFLGERSDVADLLCAADCYLMPSLWEGFSGAVVEAMAMEIPLLLSDIPSMREVTRDTAWFFSPNDDAACADLLTRVHNRDYPSELIASARQRAESELDIHAVTDQLEALYRKTIGASS